MPPNTKSAADLEIEQLLAGADNSAAPAVEPVKDLTPSPQADAELKDLLAAGPPVEKPVSDEFSGALPTPKPAPVEKPWYAGLLEQFQKQGQRQDQMTAASRAPENIKPAVGSIIHGATAHTLDPYKAERESMTPEQQRYGEILGALPLLAVPGGIGAQAGAAGGYGAVRKFNDTSGQPLGERVAGAAGEGVYDATTAGVLHGAGQGLAKLAKNATTAGEAFVPSIFMTPQQTAALRVRKGPDALPQLGRDVIDAGLLKPTNPLGYLRPASANRVAVNADRVGEESGKRIGEFRQDLVDRGIDPDVDITGMTKGLRDKAKRAVRGVDRASPRDAEIYSEQADRLEQPVEASATGSVTLPPPVPEWYASLRRAPQTALPGVQTGAKAVPAPKVPARAAEQLPIPEPVEPAQTAMDLPQAAKPEPFVPGSLEGEQLPLEGLSMPPRQRQSRNPVSTPRPPGDPQAPLFPGAEPRPAAEVPPEPGPSQSPFDLGTQREPQAPKPEPWQPGDLRSAEQVRMSGMDKPIGSQVHAPFTMNPKQDALPTPEPGGEPLTRGVGRGGVFPGAAPRTVEKPLEGPMRAARESMPLSEALEETKDIADRIKFNKNPNAVKSSYAEDVARRFTWGGFRDSIDRALEREAAAGNIQPKPFEQYKQDMKNYSTAATVEEPAIRMAERQNQAGLDMQDLAAGMLLGQPGLGASKATRGMAPATMSRGLRMAGGALKGAGHAAQGAARLAPILRARQANPGAPKSVVEDKANDDVKNDVQQRLRNNK